MKSVLEVFCFKILQAPSAELLLPIAKEKSARKAVFILPSIRGVQSIKIKNSRPFFTIVFKTYKMSSSYCDQAWLCNSAKKIFYLWLTLSSCICNNTSTRLVVSGDSINNVGTYTNTPNDFYFSHNWQNDIIKFFNRIIYGLNKCRRRSVDIFERKCHLTSMS